MKALPPHPLDYTSSDQVRAGISHAYSGVFNPRGLEKIWYGPYGHMFSELVSAYNGHLVAHCQYPLWIPSLQVLELKLRQDFKENGLDYESGDPEDTPPASDDDGTSDSSSEEDNSGSFLGGLSSTEGREPSERLEKITATQALNVVQKRRNLVRGLLEKRAAIFDADLGNYEREDCSIHFMPS